MSPHREERLRPALEAVSREGLAVMTACFDLHVADPWSQASHVRALLDARYLDMRGALRLLLREDLEGMCRAIGVPCDALDKDELIERLASVLPAPVDAGHAHVARE